MKIRNKTVYIFHISLFYNIFLCSVKNSETEEIINYEISARKNDLDSLVSFFSTIKNAKSVWNSDYEVHNLYHTDKIFCGYNNLHYGNPLINYLIEYYNVFKNCDYLKICLSLHNMSNIIISSNDDNIDLWKHWKYMVCFESMDLLTMLFSRMHRVSLKDIQISINYPDIQDSLINKDINILQLSDIDNMIKDNVNNVNAIDELLKLCVDRIQLRISIEDEYHISCLSRDDVNTGMEIIKQKYLEQTKLDWLDIKELRSKDESIILNDIIIDKILFNNDILNKVLDDIKRQEIGPEKKTYNNKFIYNNKSYAVCEGGLHSFNQPEIIQPKDDELLINLDVISMYPSILNNYDFYPKHLSNKIKNVYSDIIDKKIDSDNHNDKIRSLMFKYSLNGFTGNIQNRHSWVYSFKSAIQVRINGQLMMLMLIERLTDIDCSIIQVCTDGLFVIVKKNNSKFIEVVKEWEKLTTLKLKQTTYKLMFQYSIDSYILVKPNNTIKYTGIFNTDNKIGKSITAKIIPKAIINLLVNKISLNETIYNSDNIKDFIVYQKVENKYKIEYQNKILQHANRYYVSPSGANIYKCIIAESSIKTDCHNLLPGSKVKILNKIDNIPIKERKIDYRFYLNEAKKIIKNFKPRQLELW